MTTRTRSTSLLALVLACGPSVADSDGDGDGDGGSSTGAATSTSGVDATSVDASTGLPPTDATSVDPDGSSSSSAGTTGDPVPAECVAAGWDTSYATFQQLEAEAGGRYWHASERAVYGSGFTADCRYTTTVEIADGVAIRRILHEPEIIGDPSFCTEPPFDEIGDAVGSHDTEIAAPPWTLDVLYEGCCASVLTLQPADEYDIWFGTFDNGVLRECSAVQAACADGCEVDAWGFGTGWLVDFQLGPLPP